MGFDRISVGLQSTQDEALAFLGRRHSGAEGLRAVDDALAEGPQTATVSHAASSADPNYGGISIGSVTANIADDDMASVSVAPTTVAVTEGGASDAYDVVLTSQPTASVTVTITAGTQVTTAPTTLTFTTANWDVAQRVTVTAVDDAAAEGSHTALIGHGVSSADPTYDALVASDVFAAIADNDAARVTISPGLVNLAEGGATGTYDVWLRGPPPRAPPPWSAPPTRTPCRRRRYWP